jgi:hypothetical protein
MTFPSANSTPTRPSIAGLSPCGGRSSADQARQKRNAAVYPGYPHGVLATHADVINPDLLAFIEGYSRDFRIWGTTGDSYHRDMESKLYLLSS